MHSKEKSKLMSHTKQNVYIFFVHIHCTCNTSYWSIKVVMTKEGFTVFVEFELHFCTCTFVDDPYLSKSLLFVVNKF